MAQICQRLGLIHVADRSDPESALASMMERAFGLSGRHGIPVSDEESKMVVRYELSLRKNLVVLVGDGVGRKLNKRRSF